MSNRARLGIIISALAIVVVAFVVLNPGDSSKKADDPASNATQTTGGAKSPTATARDALPAPPEEFTIRGGKVEGGVRSIKVAKGDRVRFTVTSDRPDQIHLHGYDVEKETAPGKPAKFSVKANVEGIFEIESHKNEDAGKDPLIARLVVNPS
jgi:FtsP/CotA-like multicopper oxidase with cupredoxin domain